MYSINLVIVLNYFIASSDTNDLRRKKASENPKAALHGPQRARLAERRVRHRKILIEKIEIGPTYAPYKGKRERHDNKTTKREENLPERKRKTFQPPRRTFGNEASGRPAEDESTKRTLRKRSVGKTRRRRERREGPSNRQEELSETKRREDPPNTKAPRRPSGTEIAEKNFPEALSCRKELIQLVDNFTHHDDVRIPDSARKEPGPDKKTSKSRFGLSKQNAETERKPPSRALTARR